MRKRRRTHTFGEWLALQKDNHGWDTNDRMAAQLGTTHVTVGRWLRNESLPRRDIDTVRKIASGLGVSTVEVLTRLGYLTEEEAGTGLPEPQPLDPLVVKLNTLLQRFEQVAEWEEGRDALRQSVRNSLDSFISALEEANRGVLARAVRPVRKSSGSGSDPGGSIGRLALVDGPVAH